MRMLLSVFEYKSRMVVSEMTVGGRKTAASPTPMVVQEINQAGLDMPAA